MDNRPSGGGKSYYGYLFPTTLLRACPRPVLIVRSFNGHFRFTMNRKLLKFPGACLRGACIAPMGGGQFHAEIGTVQRFQHMRLWRLEKIA